MSQNSASFLLLIQEKKGFPPVKSLYFCVRQQKKKELLERTSKKNSYFGTCKPSIYCFFILSFYAYICYSTAIEIFLFGPYTYRFEHRFFVYLALRRYILLLFHFLKLIFTRSRQTLVRLIFVGILTRF